MSPTANLDSPIAADVTDWHAMSAADALTLLDTDLESGLESVVAEQRLIDEGPNSIDVASDDSLLGQLVRQFTDPLTAILVVAVAVSALVGELLDAVAITLILLVNGLLGFVQEWRSSQAIDALQAMLAPRAHVRRDGIAAEINASSLVRGDIVEINAGSQVPADLRLIRTASLIIDESALTGESRAVGKNEAPTSPDAPMAERSSLAHFGTVVVAGWGAGVVVATGSGSAFGDIVELTGTARAASKQTMSPLQRSLSVLGTRLGEAAVLVATLTVVAGVVAGEELREMFLVGVSLAVAIVPEGLPAVVTVTLALGLRSMSRRKALLRRLEAAESLGAASVICTDKTGTLTQNRMTVTTIWTPDGHHSITTGGEPLPATLGALCDSVQICSHASIGNDGALGDPTEVALLVAARALGAPAISVEPVHEIPFDSDSRRMTVVARANSGQLVSHVKGAVEVVAGRATMIAGSGDPVQFDHEGQARVRSVEQEMASAGLRVLAVASKPVESLTDDLDQGLTLLGLVGMHDPPRPEVAPAVASARAAGLEVIVMTGDAGPTALAISSQIGLPAETVMSGADLDRLSDHELLPLLDGSSVLARVTPEHKMRVVELLQQEGAVVAMTGDGVNDAPALEQADIGIAMGERGTDVARGAADLVLVDDNFASIVAAIEEGRRQYANIRKFICYLLSSNLGEVIAISGAVMMGWPLILLPAQILWMNLMTDGVTALALGIEPTEPDAMARPPRPVSESIVNRTGLAWILGCGLAIGLVSLAVFRIALGDGETGADLIRAQTLAFTVMVLLETVNVLNFRSERDGLLTVGLFSNPWLLVSIAGAVLAQVAAIYMPGLSDALGTSGLSGSDWAWLVVLAIPILFAGEAAKFVLRRRRLA